VQRRAGRFVYDLPDVGWIEFSVGRAQGDLALRGTALNASSPR
jgi:hypothetical protein